MEKNNLISAKDIRENLFKFIQNKDPNFTRDSEISRPDLDQYRKDYLRKILEEKDVPYSDVEEEVANKITNKEFISSSTEYNYIENFRVRISDKVTGFAGSWKFIISFFILIITWMFINIYIIDDFDPFPFILLNLLLSCITALQAPFIMMSQNNKEKKDRTRSENNYKIDLKAELEIRILHEKVDYLIHLVNKKRE